MKEYTGMDIRKYLKMSFAILRLNSLNYMYYSFKWIILSCFCVSKGIKDPGMVLAPGWPLRPPAGWATPKYKGFNDSGKVLVSVWPPILQEVDHYINILDPFLILERLWQHGRDHWKYEQKSFFYTLRILRVS